MIREDRELLTELARLNRDMAPLALRMMEGSARAAEQQHYALRLIDAGERLRHRAEEASRLVVTGEVIIEDSLALPSDTVQACRLREQRA